MSKHQTVTPLHKNNETHCLPLHRVCQRMTKPLAQTKQTKLNESTLVYTQHATDLHHFLCSQTPNEGIDRGQVTSSNI